MTLPRQIRPKVVAIILIALVCLIAVARAHTFHQPASVDVCFFSVAAHAMLGGHPLYTWIWDNKPPGIFLTYAAGELLFGYGELQIYMLGLIAAVTALVGIFFVARELTGETPAALWSAAFWAVMSSGLGLDANKAKIETFANPLFIWILFLLLRAPMIKRKALWTGAVGLLMFAVTFYKPLYLVQCAAFAIAYVLLAEREQRRSAVLQMLRIACIGAVLWGGLLGYIVVTGRLWIYYQSTVVFHGFYAPHPWLSLLTAIPYFIDRPREVLFAQYLPIVALVIVGGALGRVKLCRRTRIYMTAYAIATYIAVAMPTHFFPAYFQVWLPWMALASGCAVAKLREWKWEPRVRFSPQAASVAAIVLTGLLLNEIPHYRLSPDESSEVYFGSRDVDTYVAARTLKPLLGPGEQILHIGNNVGLYFAIGQASPSGIMFELEQLGPLRLRLSNQLADDIERSRPEVIVLGPDQEKYMPGRLSAVIADGYTDLAVPKFPERFTLKVRKNSPVLARVQAEWPGAAQSHAAATD